MTPSDSLEIPGDLGIHHGSISSDYQICLSDTLIKQQSVGLQNLEDILSWNLGKPLLVQQDDFHNLLSYVGAHL